MGICKKYPYKYKNGMLIWIEKGLGRKIGVRAGSLDSNGYRRVMSFGACKLEHRVIWEMHYGPIPEGREIDHIDKNPTNNNIKNLRLLTPTQNKSRKSGKDYEKRGDTYRVMEKANKINLICQKANEIGGERNRLRVDALLKKQKRILENIL